jgi:SAM-dependent methyltransferase
MTTSESDSGYVLPASAGESVRLERQARLYGGTSFLNPFLLESPRRVLEIGCGTGFFARHVARQLPGARVIGVDANSERLRFARELAGPDAVAFERAELTALPLADESVDLAFGRFVLVHATDPSAAIDELRRVVRPGGRIATFEMVHDGIWFSPPKPAFSRLLDAVLAVLRERGMEPDQGLHTGPALVRAGLEDVRVEALPHQALAGEPLFAEYRDNWLATIDGLGEILGRRFAREQIDAALEELRDPRPDQLLIELTVLAHGRRK